MGSCMPFSSNKIIILALMLVFLGGCGGSNSNFLDAVKTPTPIVGEEVEPEEPAVDKNDPDETETPTNWDEVNWDTVTWS